jgi:hypothetical protein
VGDEARDEACRRTTADRAGVRIFEPARDLAFALYARLLSDLYVVEGLK